MPNGLDLMDLLVRDVFSRPQQTPVEQTQPAQAPAPAQAAPSQPVAPSPEPVSLPPAFRGATDLYGLARGLGVPTTIGSILGIRAGAAGNRLLPIENLVSLIREGLDPKLQRMAELDAVLAGSPAAYPNDLRAQGIRPDRAGHAQAKARIDPTALEMLLRAVGVV